MRINCTSCVSLNVFEMCVVSFLRQTIMGSVDPSDATLCVKLAASYRWANGGLCRNVGTSSAVMDHGSHVGAADFTPTTARGKSNKEKLAFYWWKICSDLV